MNNKEPVIKIRKLKITFGSKVVLNEIDLDIFPGETLAVIGPSGTGKSTVLKVLTGLLAPTSGSVVIEGQETNSFDEAQWDELRKHMGVVFQYSALFDFLTVGENVAFGLRRHFSLPEEEIQGRVEELLKLVGLPDAKDMMPAELSGGMKKRVGLARAIATNPEIIFFDEPTTGLDPIMSDVINNLIVSCVKNLGATALTITHDMASARKIADRIAMLHKGKIVWIGTVKEIEKTDNPYVVQFINGRADGPIQMTVKADE